ncbi:MAG: hypothetical protein J07HR59_00464, partial [Halorubrum sp. J07HR59]
MVATGIDLVQSPGELGHHTKGSTVCAARAERPQRGVAPERSHRDGDTFHAGGCAFVGVFYRRDPLISAVTVSKSAYERFFPYEKPFPNQREAMDRIANALTREQDVLLEGAPGTGKTLA